MSLIRWGEGAEVCTSAIGVTGGRSWPVGVVERGRLGKPLAPRDRGGAPERTSHLRYKTETWLTAKRDGYGSWHLGKHDDVRMPWRESRIMDERQAFIDRSWSDLGSATSDATSSWQCSEQPGWRIGSNSNQPLAGGLSNRKAILADVESPISFSAPKRDFGRLLYFAAYQRRRGRQFASSLGRTALQKLLFHDLFAENGKRRRVSRFRL
jgi:hypothetical protein